MTTQQPSTASPEVLFDVNSSSSPELLFSTPQTSQATLHEDSKSFTMPIEHAQEGVEHILNGDTNLGDADKPSSKELEGLRTVNLTPTSPSSDVPAHSLAPTAHDADSTDEKRNSSPPIVLKSAPGSPSADRITVTDFVDDALSASTQANGTQGSEKDVNGSLTSHAAMEHDLDDPRELVISSLRIQISDLFSQVNLLNSKLVQSYDRVSTLEETLDENTEKLRAIEVERMNLEREKSVLELEREKQDQLLRDGKLVERSAVAAELSRLMEASLASSSAQQSAEAKHKQMESELSDLSANLFSTANEMVATERRMRASTEESLVSTRSAKASLEKQLEAARLELSGAEKEKEVIREERMRTEQEVEELRRALKGVNSSNVTSLGTGGVLRMMNSHVPYKNEYIGFLAHLRGLVATTINPPAITSLLTLPFLARLALEDSEPTLRLDLAPSLNWLTRRSVLAAIHSNTLLIEQIHVATLFLEGSTSSYSYAGFGSGTSLPTSPTQLTRVNCALCGKVVYMSPEAIQAEQNQYQSNILSQSPTTPTTYSAQTPTAAPPQRSISGGGWGASRLLKSVTLPSLGGVVASANASSSRSNSPTPRHSLDSLPPNGSGGGTPTATIPDRPPSPPPTSLQTVIHAFRVPLAGKSVNASTSNLLSFDPSQAAENYGPPYPLCHTGWCLARLRTTCELWGCVRTDVVDRIWNDGTMERRRLGSGSSPGVRATAELAGEKSPAATDSNTAPMTNESDVPPPVPPKRKLPNLWGMGKEALDKAKASYGAGSEYIGSTSPTSTTGASSFFGGVRRTFSGGAVMTSSTTSTLVSGSDLSSEGVGSQDVGIEGGGTGTVKGPALLKRSSGRLSELFTGAPTGDESSKDPQNVIVPMSDEPKTTTQDTAEPKTTENMIPEVTLAPSASVDTFVTPSETPMQELSPNPNDDARKDGASAEAFSSAISDHLSAIVLEKVVTEAPNVETDIEPPTPTPNSLGFGIAQAAPAQTIVAEKGTRIPLNKAAHARNTSIASIISEGSTRTPRPSTPVKSDSKSPSSCVGSRPGTPNKVVTTAGSRPSTPSKLTNTSSSNAANSSKTDPSSVKPGGAAPPPVPRRAAARNAARTSIAGAPKPEEKQARGSLDGVELVRKEKETTIANGVDAVKGVGEGIKNELAMEKPDEVAVLDVTIPRVSTVDTSVALTSAEGDIANPDPSKISEEPSTLEASTEAGPVASATSTPKSLSIPLPSMEPPSPTSHPVPALPPSLVGTGDGPPSSWGGMNRPRQASVVSSSSVYSPSIYTTNSGVNGPTHGGESEPRQGRHSEEAVKFYVGRESWEDRAWLQLVQIRESMFWARLGGVRY